jgi:hypothetical protein
MAWVPRDALITPTWTALTRGPPMANPLLDDDLWEVLVLLLPPP